MAARSSLTIEDRITIVILMLSSTRQYGDATALAPTTALVARLRMTCAKAPETNLDAIALILPRWGATFSGN